MTLKQSPVIRPASRADVIALNGKSFDASFRGIAVEIDGKVVGIAGVMHTPSLQFFSQFSEELRAYPNSLIMAARMMKEILGQYSSPVYSIADENVDSSIRFLEHIGFEHYEGRVYRWDKQHHG